VSDEPEVTEEEQDVEALAADVDLHAARNPPVNINVATGTAANTAGAVNVAPAGGSGAGATGTPQAPGGGSASWESGVGVTATLASISPTGAVHNAGDFSLTATGTNFLNTSVIVFNGVPQDTTYISATQVRATIPNTTGVAAGAVPVLVANGVTNPAPQTFTYT